MANPAPHENVRMQCIVCKYDTYVDDWAIASTFYVVCLGCYHRVVGAQRQKLQRTIERDINGEGGL